MKKEWYILIDNQKEGPYTAVDLKTHLKVTPDTLAWKEGFKEWTPVRYIPELKFIFEEEERSVQPIIEDQTKPVSDLLSDEATLALKQDPFQFFLWILLISVLLLYITFNYL
ncbi:MAG: DUF4339 domain-containing protein [Candidatus Protochlamydia sp.]|nr:DUF4339 domain-containing protein [Candidatus Protochlamydia sp.]